MREVCPGQVMDAVGDCVAKRLEETVGLVSMTAVGEACPGPVGEAVEDAVKSGLKG